MALMVLSITENKKNKTDVAVLRQVLTIATIIVNYATFVLNA